MKVFGALAALALLTACATTDEVATVEPSESITETATEAVEMTAEEAAAAAEKERLAKEAEEALAKVLADAEAQKAAMAAEEAEKAAMAAKTEEEAPAEEMSVEDKGLNTCFQNGGTISTWTDTEGNSTMACRFESGIEVALKDVDTYLAADAPSDG